MQYAKGNTPHKSAEGWKAFQTRTANGKTAVRHGMATRAMRKGNRHA